MLSLGSGIPPGSDASAGSLRVLARWWRDCVAEPVVSVLFPPRCVGCGDFESHLCPRCEASLEPIGGDCCPRCGEPGPRPLVGRRCSHCMGVELAYAGARSAFVHAGVAKRMVVEFKSGGQPVLAPLMARLAAPAFGELVAAAGGRGMRPGDPARPGSRLVITWVPTHRGGTARAGLQPGGAAGSGFGAFSAGVRGRRVGAQAGADAASKGPGPGRPAGQPAWCIHPGRKGLAGAAISADGTQSWWTTSITTGATTQEVSRVLTAGTGLPSRCSRSRGRCRAGAKATTE